MTEEWIYIEGYGKRYQVSNAGNVRSFYSTPRLLKFNSDGSYYYVTLAKSRKCKTFRVHRLVATYFVLNPKNKPQVNHIDGNKLNNNSSNLEWTTGVENMKHAVENGLICSGKCHYLSKLTMEKAREIRLKNSKGVSNRELGIEYGVNSRTIYGVVKNITWKEVNL